MDQSLHLHKGRYHARIAADPADLAAAQALRAQCFRSADAGNGTPQDAADADSFDARCRHVLIEDARNGALVCCFRVFPLATAHEILHSYSAQFYDLTALTRFHGPMLEIGRFCMHPDHHDPDILRIAWGVLAQWVDASGVRLLFGCSSFPGDNAERHRSAFGLLHSKYRAPPRWSPKPKAPERFQFDAEFANHPPQPLCGPAALPPLLRTYLMMGGWVSDHAVFDRQLHTMHVFTGVEIDAIPPTRARLLRAVAS